MMKKNIAVSIIFSVSFTILTGCHSITKDIEPKTEHKEETSHSTKVYLYPTKGYCGYMKNTSSVNFGKLSRECDLSLIREKDDAFISLKSAIDRHETVLLVFDIPKDLLKNDIQSSKIYLNNVHCNRENNILYSSNTGYKGFEKYSNTNRGNFVCEKDNIAGNNRISYDSIELDADIIDGQVKVVLQATAFTKNNGEIPFDVDEVHLILTDASK